MHKLVDFAITAADESGSDSASAVAIAVAVTVAIVAVAAIAIDGIAVKSNVATIPIVVAAVDAGNAVVDAVVDAAAIAAEFVGIYGRLLPHVQAFYSAVVNAFKVITHMEHFGNAQFPTILINVKGLNVIYEMSGWRTNV